MESLFSTLGEGTHIYPWIIPPKGQATHGEDFKKLESTSSDPAWVNPKIISGAMADLRPLVEEELSDEEILLLATRSGSFSFWDDKEEEIYSEQDGTPIK